MCISPFHLKDSTGTIWQTVPCGQCLECRIARTRDWKYRMKFELTSWSSASFVTLTYDDEHLPTNRSLIKEDLQKYFKRLRYYLSEKYGKDYRIKYFACGEYGDKLQRPHYHAIIFGVGPVTDREIIQKSWNKCKWQFLSSSSIGNVTDDSIQYVSGYIQKKQLGKANTEKYEKMGLLPPFQICSQGLGLQFLMSHADLFREQGCIKDKGKNIPLPRYYKKKLDFKATDGYVELVENMRERNRKDREDLELLVKGNLSVLVPDFWKQWQVIRTQYPSVTPEQALEQGLITDTQLLSSYIRFHRAESLANKHRLLVKSRKGV